MFQPVLPFLHPELPSHCTVKPHTFHCKKKMKSNVHVASFHECTHEHITGRCPCQVRRHHTAGTGCRAGVTGSGRRVTSRNELVITAGLFPGFLVTSHPTGVRPLPPVSIGDRAHRSRPTLTHRLPPAAKEPRASPRHVHRQQPSGGGVRPHTHPNKPKCHVCWRLAHQRQVRMPRQHALAQIRHGSLGPGST